MQAAEPDAKRHKPRHEGARATDKLAARRAEIRANEQWVSTEVLCLLYDRYASHVVRGCTPEHCVDHGPNKVTADSLACPVCQLTSLRAPISTHKLFTCSDLADMCVDTAAAHGKELTRRHFMFSFHLDNSGIEGLAPRKAPFPFPYCHVVRCWAVTSWSKLALELSAIARHTKYRVAAINDRLQRHAETTGNTFTQASAVLQRLCRSAGIPYTTPMFTATAQLVQYARLNKLSAFEPELDRVKYRVALNMEKTAQA